MPTSVILALLATLFAVVFNFGTVLELSKQAIDRLVRSVSHGSISRRRQRKFQRRAARAT